MQRTSCTNRDEEPARGFDPQDEGPVVVLDAAADVEWNGGKPTFYVTRAPNGSAAAAGDIIDEVDGVSASELLIHDLHRSNGNNGFTVSHHIAGALTRRSTRTAPQGSRAVWMQRPRDGGLLEKLELTRRAALPMKDEGSDYAIDYSRARCSDRPTVAYGAYALTSEGPNFCLYTSKDARYGAYPIARYFSFSYFRGNDEGYAPGFHRALADHDARLSQLAAVTGARGVLLDLRDNHGGSNPNLVMDWFAPGPYTDHYVFTKLHDDLRDPNFRRDASVGRGGTGRASS